MRGKLTSDESCMDSYIGVHESWFKKFEKFIFRVRILFRAANMLTVYFAPLCLAENFIFRVVPHILTQFGVNSSVLD